MRGNPESVVRRIGNGAPFALAPHRQLFGTMESDRDLLRQYVHHGSQAAFTTLVQRHINVVYRTALRRVGGNRHAADDVTQRVFLALSRKAEQVRDHASLAGWLYTSTRFAAAELVRAEQRRRKYEQEAHTMNQLNAPDSLSPEQLEPLLDEVLENLPERDREAVLLYFFERRSFVEIAALLSSTADATRMRVNRTLERLRQDLARRGVASTGAALSAALGAQATVAATLPDAAAVAARVLASASTVPLVGASIGARILAIVRSAPIAITAGVALVTGGIVVTRHALAEHPAAAPAVEAPARSVLDGGSGSSPITPPSSATSAPRAATANVSPTVTSPVQGDPSTRFDQFTPQEKSILTVLWRLHLRAPSAPTGLGIGPGAPNFGGIDPLVSEGLIEERPALQPRRRRVRLTAAGLQFCAAAREVIDHYQPTVSWAPLSDE